MNVSLWNTFMLWPDNETFVPQDNEPDKPAAPVPARSSRWGRRAFHWGVLLAVAVIIYEATSRFDAVIVLFAVYFLAERLRNGWWLLRRDPQWGRGLAGFFFLSSLGLWKSVIVTIVLAAVGLNSAGLFHLWKGVQIPDQPMLQAGRVGLGLWCLAEAFSSLGAMVARVCRVKLWISDDLTVSRQADHWPPIVLGPNLLHQGMLEPTLLPLIVTVVVAYESGVSIPVLIAIVAVILLGWSLKSRSGRWIIAATPDESWGPSHMDLHEKIASQMALRAKQESREKAARLDV